MERKKRNPAMPLVDQILLDKLESDLDIEETMGIYLESIKSASLFLIEQIKYDRNKSRVRIIAIKNQIKSINEHYE